MSTYEIQFWAFETRQIRSGSGAFGIKSGSSDTVYCGVSVNHAGDPPNLRIGLGGNSVIAAEGVSNFVKLVCNLVTVADNADDSCTIVWSAMNCGTIDDNSRQGVMRRSLDLLAGKVGAVSFGPAGDPNDLFANDTDSQWLNLLDLMQADPGMNAYSLPTGGCDGWLCGGAITLSGAELATGTANRNLNIYVFNQGYNSPDGCGENSRYQSQLIIRKSG